MNFFGSEESNIYKALYCTIFDQYIGLFNILWAHNDIAALRDRHPWPDG